MSTASEDAARERAGTMPWKLFFLLAALGAVGSAAVLPYAVTGFGGAAEAAGVPRPLMALATFLQGLLLVTISAFVGLRLARRTALGAPVLEALVYRKRPLPDLRPLLGLSALLGAAAGGAIIALDLAFAPFVDLSLAEGARLPSWWQGLLASLYGGVSEEIMMRLGVLNVVVWLLSLRRAAGAPRGAWAVWIGILAAAVLFGVGHLGGAAAAFELTPMLVARVLVLNAVPGVMFGLLFWKKGLLAAMSAHFAANLVLHAALPLVRDVLLA